MKGTEQCGSPQKEGDCYASAHSWPSSWEGPTNNASTDMFNVMPSDGYVIGKRSNIEYGFVPSASWTSNQGHKIGDCSGVVGTCFEPTDAIKGVLARGIFHGAT